jgi:hypothetical protein
MNIVSACTHQVRNGEQPSSVDIRDHLAIIHDETAGFAEAFAWHCCDSNRKI